jgi:tetratricopeptide (TPR) repeat protein
MDEITLMALVAEGEATGRVEFKRELHLDKAEEKAEFIKDIISLSNSAPQNKAYLLVGVDNAKYIIGIDKLEEERIQQLVHSHIRPSVKLRCTIISTTVPSLASVGIIEVEGTERPYRVSIPIDKLRQDDIFVRHGSVVEKATPEEIRRMDDETQSFKETSRQIYAAETHLELGNFQDAIDIYTQAIKAMPSAELFLGRGKIYRRRIEENKLSDKNEGTLADLALKDFSTAIRLTKIRDIEKSSRLERVRLNNLVYIEYKEWEEDIKWLKDKTTGREFGEMLYLEYQCYEDRIGYSYEEPGEVLVTMTRAIESGYTEPRVYELRAKANFSLCNYGLALQDIDIALANTTTTKIDQRIDFYTLRANIQVKMAKFVEAYSSLSAARTLYRLMSNAKFRDHIGSIAWDIEDEILWRFGLEAEFGEMDLHFSARAILSILINHLTKVYDKASFEKNYAQIIPIIKRVVGDD